MYVFSWATAVLRTKGMRIRAIGEWQYTCSCWATAVLNENFNEIRAIEEQQYVPQVVLRTKRMRMRAKGEWQNVCMSQLGHETRGMRYLDRCTYRKINTYINR